MCFGFEKCKAYKAYKDWGRFPESDEMKKGSVILKDSEKYRCYILNTLKIGHLDYNKLSRKEHDCFKVELLNNQKEILDILKKKK